MSRYIRINKKWMFYTIELLITFLIQFTPAFFPRLFNVTPNFLLALAVSVAVFEGEKAGMWYGIAAGFLMDFAGYKITGFNAMFMAVLCYFCGYLVTNLMRNNLFATALLTFGSAVILGILRWFFFYVLWSMPDIWYELYAVTLPIIALSLLFSPVFFIINKTINNSFSEDRY